jgi:DNA repair exonuclease SbcCD nuclease subunit
MKIVHLSDTHLGARQLHYTNERGRNVREQDVYDTFAAAVEKILELRPAAVIHAGDMFDGYHPSAAALGVGLDQIARLRDAGIEIVIASGNHSTPRAASADHVFALLERFGGVHAVHHEPRVIEIGGLAVTVIPHCNDREQMSAWITQAEPAAKSRFNVLVAHVGLDGLGHVGASEAGSVELAGETLEAVADFNYVALGHLHKFDRVRQNAAYAGSLEQLTWADDASKGILEIDLAVDPLEDGFMTKHQIACRRHLCLPAVDASQSENLTTAIVAAARRDDLEGAIVKLPIRSVMVEAYGGIDRRQVSAAFEDCLHFELDPTFIDAASTGANPAAPQDLRDFLSHRVPKGVEASEFIARAEACLTRAAEEIGA